MNREPDDLSTHEPTHDAADDPGVRATRRAVFRGGAALASVGLLSAWSRASARVAPSRAADAAAFLEEWAQRAGELAASDEPNEDACVHELGAGLARLEPSSFPARTRVSFENDAFRSGPVVADGTFLVIQFDMEPGAVIEAHNHVGFLFLSVGVSGSVRVRHFEPEAGAPAPSELGRDFRVHEVTNTLLLPGRTSSLTRTRANVHWFQAGHDGARFLDFGIRFPDAGDGPTTFSKLDFDRAPLDPEQRLFQARWIGNPK